MRTPGSYLFDLDGTLIDSIELILRSFRHTLRTHRGVVPPDEAWLAGVGTPLRAQLHSFTDDPSEIDEMLTTYREYNLAHHDEMVRSFPGTRAALLALRSGGAKLAVVTSKARNGMDRGLLVCGLEGLFDALVAADDVSKHKPDPEPVLRALQLLDADPNRTVFIGDSPHDMVAGRRAGVRTAAALWGPFSRSDLEPHAPDFWLMRPADIETLAA